MTVEKRTVSEIRSLAAPGKQGPADYSIANVQLFANLCSALSTFRTIPNLNMHIFDVSHVVNKRAVQDMPGVIPQRRFGFKRMRLFTGILPNQFNGLQRGSIGNMGKYCNKRWGPQTHFTLNLKDWKGQMLHRNAKIHGTSYF